MTGFFESAGLLCWSLPRSCSWTICSRIGVPSIVGYILAGIVIGPAGLGLIAENAALSSIGEIGVVLLLFALGLEFSFEKLVTLRKYRIPGSRAGCSHHDVGVVDSESRSSISRPPPQSSSAGPLPC